MSENDIGAVGGRLTDVERLEYGQRADSLLPNQIVYSLTSVEAIVRARLIHAAPAPRRLRDAIQPTRSHGAAKEDQR